MSKLKSSKFKRVMVFGSSFSGKSLLTGKLAEHFNLIWLDLEAGSGVLLQLPEEWQGRIELVALPDTASYPIAIETLPKLLKGKVSICDLHGKVNCIVCKRTDEPTTEVDVNSMGKETILVVDSLTQLGNSAMSTITREEADDYKYTFNDYGKQGMLLDKALSHIQQAQYHVVCISHVNVIETLTKKTLLTPTGGTRNFSRNITKYFTDVVYLDRKNNRHTCISSTTAATNIAAGSQTNVALELLDEPSLLPLFMPELAAELIEKAVGKDKEKASKLLSKKPVATGASAAASMLERLRNKK